MEMRHPVAAQAGEASFMVAYLESLSLVERLHRLLLDVIKDEFERVGILEINAVQALLLPLRSATVRVTVLPPTLEQSKLSGVTLSVTPPQLSLLPPSTSAGVMEPLPASSSTSV